MRSSRFLAIGLIATVVWTAACNKAPLPAASSEAKSPGKTNLVRLDPAFDQLVATNATIDNVATGFQFLEGHCGGLPATFGHHMKSNPRGCPTPTPR
jgi:hypothetical protein